MLEVRYTEAVVEPPASSNIAAVAVVVAGEEPETEHIAVAAAGELVETDSVGLTVEPRLELERTAIVAVADSWSPAQMENTLC